LERIALALADRSAIVVAPKRLLPLVGAMMPRAVAIGNDEPSRGMTHSLRLGLRRVARTQAFGVLLADMPAITTPMLSRTEARLTGNVDVAYPVNAQRKPGHPVLFSARARAIIETLPEGDTLRQARDHPSMRRAIWHCADDSAFLDLDVLADWEAFADT
jgi:CTP:molybdopterin cytidylyltransferase MocA